MQTVGVGDLVEIGLQEPKPNNAVSVEAQIAVAGTPGRLGWITDVVVTADETPGVGSQQECWDLEEEREQEHAECLGGCESTYIADSGLCKLSCHWLCGTALIEDEIVCSVGFD